MRFFQPTTLDCSFERNAATQSHPQRAVWHACDSGQLGDCHDVSVPSHSNVSARVECLVGIRGPSAILRRVRTVVVDAVNRVLQRRSRSHVGVERGVVVPALADGNASAAVARIFVMLGIQASLPHRQPRRVFNTPASYGVSMSALSFSYPSTTHTPTRARGASSDVPLLRDDDTTAIATELPSALVNTFHRTKQPERFACFHCADCIAVGQL